MAKHVNDMCEKNGADAWTTEHARSRWTKYFSKYKTTKGKFTDNTGTKYCLTAKDRKNASIKNWIAIVPTLCEWIYFSAIGRTSLLTVQ